MKRNGAIADATTVARSIWLKLIPSHLTHIESPLLTPTLELPPSARQKGTGTMQMAATKYLALDVHQATCTFTVRDAKGHVLERGVVQTVARELVALLGRFGRGRARCR